jgi:hypothetical protein
MYAYTYSTYVYVYEYRQGRDIFLVKFPPLLLNDSAILMIIETNDKDKDRCPCTLYEGFWGRGGKVSPILTFLIRLSHVISFMPWLTHSY